MPVILCPTVVMYDKKDTFHEVYKKHIKHIDSQFYRVKYLGSRYNRGFLDREKAFDYALRVKGKALNDLMSNLRLLQSRRITLVGRAYRDKIYGIVGFFKRRKYVKHSLPKIHKRLDELDDNIMRKLARRETPNNIPQKYDQPVRVFKDDELIYESGSWI